MTHKPHNSLFIDTYHRTNKRMSKGRPTESRKLKKSPQICGFFYACRPAMSKGVSGNLATFGGIFGGIRAAQPQALKWDCMRVFMPGSTSYPSGRG
jgi:hypothetical protein